MKATILINWLEVAVSMDQDAIVKDAKKIMDDFYTALEKANLKDVPVGLEREQSTRDPKANCDDDQFTSKMLDNAPKVKDNCIVAEKKSW